VPALDFLIAANRVGLGDLVPEFDSGRLNADGKDVAVIGGGDTAMDVLRIAIRRGAAEAETALVSVSPADDVSVDASGKHRNELDCHRYAKIEAAMGGEGGDREVGRDCRLVRAIRRKITLTLSMGRR